MARWYVVMTFAGHVDAETASAATKSFKAELGISPESMRPEVRMTEMRAFKVDGDDTQTEPQAG